MDARMKLGYHQFERFLFTLMNQLQHVAHRSSENQIYDLDLSDGGDAETKTAEQVIEVHCYYWFRWYYYFSVHIFPAFSII